MSEKEPCFKCGTLTGRHARLTDDGHLDINVPLRPVCDECGPKWIPVSVMESGRRRRPLSPQELDELRTLDCIELPSPPAEQAEGAR